MSALLAGLFAVLALTCLCGWIGAARRAAWLNARLTEFDRLDLERALGRRCGKVIPLYSVRGDRVVDLQSRRFDFTDPKGAA